MYNNGRFSRILSTMLFVGACMLSHAQTVDLGSFGSSKAVRYVYKNTPIFAGGGYDIGRLDGSMVTGNPPSSNDTYRRRVSFSTTLIPVNSRIVQAKLSYNVSPARQAELSIYSFDDQAPGTYQQIWESVPNGTLEHENISYNTTNTIELSQEWLLNAVTAAYNNNRSNLHLGFMSENENVSNTATEFFNLKLTVTYEPLFAQVEFRTDYGFSDTRIGDFLVDGLMRYHGYSATWETRTPHDLECWDHGLLPYFTDGGREYERVANKWKKKPHDIEPEYSQTPIWNDTEVLINTTYTAEHWRRVRDAFILHSQRTDEELTGSDFYLDNQGVNSGAEVIKLNRPDDAYDVSVPSHTVDPTTLKDVYFVAWSEGDFGSFEGEDWVKRTIEPNLHHFDTNPFVATYCDFRLQYAESGDEIAGVNPSVEIDEDQSRLLVTVDAVLNIGGQAYVFVGWGDGVMGTLSGGQYTRALTLGEKSPTGYETAMTARYKMHMATNKTTSLTTSEGATCVNNQRKVDYVPVEPGSSDGIYHAVYESINRVWYVTSTNNGADWAAEIPLSYTSASADHSAIYVDADSIWFAWKETGVDDEIVVGKFNPNYPNSYAVRRYGTPANYSPDPDATPVLVRMKYDDNSCVVVVYESYQGQLAYAFYLDGMLVENELMDIFTEAIQVRPSIARTSDNYFELVWREDDLLKHRVGQVTSTPEWHVEFYPEEIVPLNGDPAYGAPSIAHYHNADNPTQLYSLVATEAGDGTSSMIKLAGRVQGGWTALQTFFGNPEIDRIWAPSASLINRTPPYLSVENIRVSYNYTAPIAQPTTRNINTIGFYYDPPPGLGSYTINITQTFDALHPSTVIHPPDDAGRQIHTLFAGAYGGIESTNMWLQKTATPEPLPRSRDLVLRRDTSLIRIGLGDLHLKNGPARIPIRWHHGYDTSIVGKTVSVENEFRTETFTIPVGYSVKYETRTKKRGLHDWPTGLIGSVELIDAATSNVLGTLEQYTCRTMQQGGQGFLRNHQLGQFGGRNVYVRFRLEGMDSAVQLYAEDYYALPGPNTSAFPRRNGGTVQRTVEIPEVTTLGTNYPNPVVSESEIPYSVSETADVTLVVTDMLGRRVATLVSGTLEPGSYLTRFDAAGLPPGMYVYILTAGGKTLLRTMVVSD